MKNKGDALSDFMKMIFNSWTYKRMTEQERERLKKAFNSAQARELKGDYKTRWAALQFMYIAFLNALGFNGFNWREQNAEQIPF